jgi:hypothetical protein
MGKQSERPKKGRPKYFGGFSSLDLLKKRVPAPRKSWEKTTKPNPRPSQIERAPVTVEGLDPDHLTSSSKGTSDAECYAACCDLLCACNLKNKTHPTDRCQTKPSLVSWEVIRRVETEQPWRPRSRRTTATTRCSPRASSRRPPPPKVRHAPCPAGRGCWGFEVNFFSSRDSSNVSLR